MDIKLDIEPKHIEEMVTKAIIDSSVGTAIKSVVEKEIKELSYSYNKGLHEEVRKQITVMIRETLKEPEFYNTMQGEVRKVLSEKLTESIVANIVMTAVDKLQYNEYKD